jgi:hypothetical protein
MIVVFCLLSVTECFHVDVPHSVTAFRCEKKEKNMAYTSTEEEFSMFGFLSEDLTEDVAVVYNDGGNDTFDAGQELIYEL